MNKSRKPNVLIFLFAFAALAISVYILVAVKSHQVLYGCGAGGCHEILEGRWERWGPLPVAALGIGGYLALMAASVFTAISQLKKGYMMVWYLMAIEGIVGLGFIAWLIFLQGAVIKHYCLYCLSSHLFGIVAYAITIMRVPVWSQHKHSKLMVGTTASVILVFMISIHVAVVPEINAAENAADIEYATPQNTSGGMIQFGKAKEDESRTVHLLNNQLTFDLYKVPVLGKRDAKYVILELSDYCCPSCRKLSSKMVQFREIYDLEICVVYLPVPMNSSCNSNVKKTPRGFKDSCLLAEYAMAVNYAAPEKFEEFHDYMMQGSTPPKPKIARKKAEELIGAKKFKAALENPKTKEWIQTGVRVQRFIKAKTIPRMITKDHLISYSGGSKAGFAKLIKKVLDIDELKKRE